MNPRKTLYFIQMRLRGQSLPQFYERFFKQDQNGIPPDTTEKLLIQMLAHCERAVPYYAEVIRNLGASFYKDPGQYLLGFPILTKDIIRSRFDDLKSVDLSRRKWCLNTSGGSTGEPVQFIQDWEYNDRSEALTTLYSRWAGREIGELEVRLWGSEGDIFQESRSWRATLSSKLTNTMYLNAFRMTSEKMGEFIGVLNARRPKLIVAYAQAVYELAKFAERERIEVIPQAAIMTSAGTLYPFMREKLQEVFQCKVFNRYGSREVGDIACERPGYEGLWIAPWGNYVEIVDNEGNPVPDSAEGNILVTSLTNFAMPLIRYQIGDRGVLSARKNSAQGGYAQVLERVVGRTVDTFRTKNGTLIDGEYFTHLLYFRDWVWKFQVIQKSHLHIVFKIVKSRLDYQQPELDEITTKTKLVMGDDCTVAFEFVDEIPPGDSGKYRYTISEVQG